MFETLDELKSKDKELDRYKRFIMRQEGYHSKNTTTHHGDANRNMTHSISRENATINHHSGITIAATKFTS